LVFFIQAEDGIRYFHVTGVQTCALPICALIVLGLDKVVEEMCSGGFQLDVGFSATRLRELSKMDGAVVLDRDANRILRAAVQLLPDPTIETTKSGTLDRTADRVAYQRGI